MNAAESDEDGLYQTKTVWPLGRRAAYNVRWSGAPGDEQHKPHAADRTPEDSARGL